MLIFCTDWVLLHYFGFGGYSLESVRQIEIHLKEGSYDAEELGTIFSEWLRKQSI